MAAALRSASRLCRAPAAAAASSSRRVVPQLPHAAARRSLSSTPPTPNEVALMQQISRLEQRNSELEEMLPQSRERPVRITDWEGLTFGIQRTNGHVRHV